MNTNIFSARFEIGHIAATACLGAMLAPQLDAADASTPRKPNFLFVYTDDQRWDAIGVVQKEQGKEALFPWLRTPSMDRIAAEGLRFRNAFVTHSLCSPSRASFLTGQYSILHGVTGNVTSFPESNTTLASVLTASGYRTGYFGKWHMGKQNGKRPGFTTSASYIGQGHYMDEPFEVDGKQVPSKGYIDDITTDYAIKFITENKEKPFLAMVGFKAVHGPCTPRPSEAGLYAGSEYQVPPNINTITPFKEAGGGKSQEKSGKRTLSQDKSKYFQCTTGADVNLGRLLDTLDSLGLTEDTVVVFTSDNGLFHGEHGLGDKRFAYDESLRIPFLLRYPRLNKKELTCDSMILNIDLAPTFLDLAGVKIPDTMQGSSFKPLIEGKIPEKWRKSFYYEYHVDKEYPKVPQVQAVRTETAKLIRYPGHDDWTELFNLKQDPYEMKNLFSDPASADLRKELEAEFLRLQKAAAKPEKIN